MDKNFVFDPNCPVPRFIAAADSAMNHLKDHFSDEHPVAMFFFGQKFAKDNLPYEYHRCAAFGDDNFLITTISECFNMQPTAYKIITRAWYHHFLSVTKANDPDMAIRDARRAILRLIGKTEGGTPRTPEDDARDIIDQIAREHPERSDRINVLTAKAKQYRRAGLKDMQQHMDEEVARLQSAIAGFDEMLRVRQLRKQEALELQRLEHDYDSMGRRVRNYRAMIDRLTSEMEALQQEQRDLQQRNPQFDPHSAAKKKRQQLAERKRERAAHKKKGKESLPDTTRSCSPMLSKKGA